MATNIERYGVERAKELSESNRKGQLGKTAPNKGLRDIDYLGAEKAFEKAEKLRNKTLEFYKNHPVN